MSGPYEPGVSMAVVNYRTHGDLEECVTSLLEHAPRVPWDLTIVNVDPDLLDRATGEGLVELGRGLGAEIRLLTFEDNCGYARAVNRAAAGRRREVVAAFNADVRVGAGAVDGCVGALLGNEDWGVLGPRQVDDQGRLTAAGIFGTDSRPVHRGWHVPDRGQYADVRDDAVTVSGAAYFVKREVWDILTDCSIYRREHPDAEGALLPTPLFYEDTWASYHARAHGWRCVYYGPVTITHLWHRACRGSGGDRFVPSARAMFRAMCRAHGLESE